MMRYSSFMPQTIKKTESNGSVVTDLIHHHNCRPENNQSVSGYQLSMV